MRHDETRYCLLMKGRLCGLLFVCALSCTKTNPDATCPDGTCSDPAHPYCDFDGAISGTAGVCISVSCTPGAVKECSGSDQALTCTANGSDYELDDCTLGCAIGPSPHCMLLQPKYVPNICATPATDAQLAFGSGSGSSFFDPNVDANCNGGILPQAGTGELCVVHYGTISIGSDAALTILGCAGSDCDAVGSARAIALVADDALSVDGEIDVNGHMGVNGPGGGAIMSGGVKQFNDGSNDASSGGGGAGGATAGAPGGDGTTNGTGTTGGGAPGGDAMSSPSALDVLVGGASSYREVGVVGGDTNFGGGGGALTLISCRGTVSVSGTIDAGGGGGAGGWAFIGIPVPGWGGGAGGTVVIQAARVVITGSLFANGGAGGGGGQSNETALLDDGGQDGSLSDSMPAYGTSAYGAGAGGNGGFIGGLPTPGSAPTGSGAAGGGGGSVGFLQVYTTVDGTPTITPVQVSPAFQPNGTVETQ